MQIRKGQLAILIINLLALAGFSVHFIAKANYEFVIYIAVIAFFLVVFLATNHKVYYPNALLWALTAWAVMHMAGGAVFINGIKLYEIILIPLSSKYPIFRYDQLVHIIGFATATVAMFYILKPLLREQLEGYWALSIIVISAGLGVGALNEIIEFITAVIVSEVGVGGYLNTSLDLVSDLIGATLAMITIRVAERDFFSGSSVKNRRKSLLIIYVPALLIILLWPVGPAMVFVKGQILHQQICSADVCYHCGPGARIVDYIYFSSVAIGLWWTILGALCYVWPRAVRILFGLFADRFTRKHAVWLMVIGIFVAVLFAGALWQSSGRSVQNTPFDSPDYPLSCFALA